MKKHLSKIIVCFIATTLFVQHVHASKATSNLSPEALVKQKILELKTDISKAIKERVKAEKKVQFLQQNLITLDKEIMVRNKTLYDLIVDRSIEEAKKLEEVKKAVKNGAYINSSFFSQSPFDAAISIGLPKIIKFLIDSGADIHSRVLFYAKTPEVVKILVDAGADLNSRMRSKGRTPLINAIIGKNFEKALALIEAGADVNLASKRKFTPLMRATLSGNLEIVKALLQNGANPNKAYINGETPLIAATKKHNLALMTLLIKKGANPGAKDKSGKKAINYVGKNVSNNSNKFKKMKAMLSTSSSPFLSAPPIR